MEFRVIAYEEYSDDDYDDHELNRCAKIIFLNDNKQEIYLTHIGSSKGKEKDFYFSFGGMLFPPNSPHCIPKDDAPLEQWLLTQEMLRKNKKILLEDILKELKQDIEPFRDGGLYIQDRKNDNFRNFLNDSLKLVKQIENELSEMEEKNEI